MDKEIAETILEVCGEEGIEASIYENYSGRGMYGGKTTGVTFEGSILDVLSAVINWSEYFEEISIRQELRMDALGLQTIIY